MKPKYIFSAVLAVSILLSVLLPSIGAHRVKTVDAAAGPSSSRAAGSSASQAAGPSPTLAAAATLPPVTVSQAVQQPTPMPTLAPFQASADVTTPAGIPQPSASPTIAPILPPISVPAANVAPDQAANQPATAASAQAKIPETALPGLQAFAASFSTLPTDQVAGTYVRGLFALPVVQQPADNPDYVSPEDHTLTQFIKPERFGVIGLLAHNFLSGKPFDQLNQGQEVVVVYGGGKTATFQVSAFQHYQAVNPEDTNTDYIDLDDPQNPALTQQQVFDRMYTNAGQLVLQTCIEKNGDYSWGRLFVIATPE